MAVIPTSSAGQKMVLEKGDEGTEKEEEDIQPGAGQREGGCETFLRIEIQASLPKPTWIRLHLQR